MRGGRVKCHLCGGTMVKEKFYGICEYFFGWRCILCGEIVDQTILENRSHWGESAKVPMRRRVRDTEGEDAR